MDIHSTNINMTNNSGTTYSAPQHKVNTGLKETKQSETVDIPQVEKQLIQAIEKANHLQANQTECEFSVHKDTKQIMIKLIDSSTKEIIKEIPSEKVLDMVAHMCELAGIFVDEKR